MLKRELKNYEWQYVNGEVILIDKRNKTVMKLPMSAFDSLLRAGVSFKSAHAIDKAKKVQERLDNKDRANKALKKKIADKREKDKQKRELKKKFKAKLRVKKTRKIIAQSDVQQGEFGFTVSFQIAKDQLKKGQKLVADIE